MLTGSRSPAFLRRLAWGKNLQGRLCEGSGYAAGSLSLQDRKSPGFDRDSSPQGWWLYTLHFSKLFPPTCMGLSPVSHGTRIHLARWDARK